MEERTLLETDRGTWKVVPLGSLYKAKWNYKEDDAEMEQKLRNNISRIGQVENLLIRHVENGYEVVNGNHRVDALRDLKETHAICFDFGDISRKEAIRLAIETNETKWQADYVLMADRFRDLIAEYEIEDLGRTFPFSTEEIEAMGGELNFDWDEFDDVDPHPEEEEGGVDYESFDIALDRNLVDTVESAVSMTQTYEESKPLRRGEAVAEWARFFLQHTAENGADVTEK